MGGEERDFLGCAEVWDEMGTKLGSAKGGGEVGGVDRELMQLPKYLKESGYDSNKYKSRFYTFSYYERKRWAA